MRAKVVDARQRLAARRAPACASPSTRPANILVIGATNRAADLDPALVRPGRFDRNIYFGLPGRAGRRDIFDYYLGKKAHEPELDDPARRETLAAMTAGYSPVMIEHLLDEALVWALRRGADRLSWNDVQQAKMTEEIGLAQPVEYTEAERRTIATHEAGHATVAWLVGKGRKLEVLTIVKRRDALGLLSHSETEERFTKTRTEVRAMIDIAFGGMVAEELFFGESSTGVASDLQAATAQRLPDGRAARHGELADLGGGHRVAGRRASVGKVLSDEPSRAEVEALLDDSKARSPGCSRSTATSSRPCATRCSCARADRRGDPRRHPPGRRPTRTSSRPTCGTGPRGWPDGRALGPADAAPDGRPSAGRAPPHDRPDAEPGAA